jgi:hypothetical protein
MAPRHWADGLCCEAQHLTAHLNHSMPSRIKEIACPLVYMIPPTCAVQVAQQFDTIIHLDRTSALEPLEWGEIWKRPGGPEEEPPETYPYGV